MAKRKHASAEQQSLQHGGQTGIVAFGTIGKAHNPQDVTTGLKKRKLAHQPQSFIVQSQVQSSKTKRKREIEVDTNELKQGPCEGASNRQNKRIKNARLPTPHDTPSKCAADLLSSMKLDRASAPIPFPLSTARVGYETPPMTPESQMDDCSLLPTELNDLLSLHASFLSALSMYYAHNGTSSPVELKTLLPMITKHWKKRTASLDDLRMILAVDLQEESEFQLKEFGRAGIRLVKAAPRGRAIRRSASFVDEVGLSTRFEDALRQRWADWITQTALEPRPASLFLDQLPLADIEKDSSVEKAAPMFARGQQRLADIKASQAVMIKELAGPALPTSQQKSAAAVQSRGTSLLDRILAKQALSSTLPAGPTRDQLERKAALQRIEDIARVLELLAAGKARCSFSMQAISQQLRQSLRNPISKEEIERCLDLMAKEITPGFVNLLQNGGVTGVVITKSGKVGSEELRQRIQAACQTS